MEIKISCPYCGAENVVEEGYESVFCSVCGQKTEIKYTGGVDLIEPWMRKREEAYALIELKEYEKAERIVAQLMKEDPGNYWLYRPYIDAITENLTKMNEGNRGRVLGLMDKMIAVAPEEYKEETVEFKEYLRDIFDLYKKDRESQEWGIKAENERINMLTSVVFVIVSVVLLAMSFFLYKDPVVVEITRLLFGIGAAVCVGMFLVHILKYKKALRRYNKLSAEVNARVERMRSD